MPAESVALLVKQLFPGRPIVIVACNADGVSFHVSGVWYAHKIVSSVPHLGKKEWAESVWEFEEGK